MEPTTPGQESLADRTFTVVADGGGLPVTEHQPGVTISRSFDALGRLILEAGAGPGVPGATRSFGYDLAGRRTSVGHPDGPITLASDDRGLVPSASTPGGAAVASSFSYDGAGRMTSRADSGGVTTYTWPPTWSGTWPPHHKPQQQQNDARVAEVYDAADRAQRRLHREVNTTIVSAERWASADEPFLREIRSRPLVPVAGNGEGNG